MRTFRLEGPHHLVPTEIPEPRPADLSPGDVLVRVRAAAICGSDVAHYSRGRPPAGPTPPGYPLHEIAGDVLASRDPSLEAGDRVVGWASAMDGLSERVVTAGEGLAPYGRTLAPVEAVVAQPLACVLSAADRLPSLEGKHVAVLGLGPIGLLFAHSLRQAGAARVTGVDPVDRTDVGNTFGVTDLVMETSDAWANAISDGDRPDVVVEAVGHRVEPVLDALAGVRTGGFVYCFGIPHPEDYPINLTALVRRRLTLAGGVTTDRRTWLEEALNHLGRFPALARALVTDTVSRGAAPEAFDSVYRPRPGQAKIVLTDEAGSADEGVVHARGFRAVRCHRDHPAP